MGVYNDEEKLKQRVENKDEISVQIGGVKSSIVPHLNEPGELKLGEIEGEVLNIEREYCYFTLSLLPLFYSEYSPLPLFCPISTPSILPMYYVYVFVFKKFFYYFKLHLIATVVT